MDISLFIAFVLGMLFGGGAVYFIYSYRLKIIDSAKSKMEEAFSSLSMEALKKNNEQFFILANEKFKNQTDKGEVRLEEKKKLIDERLKEMVVVMEDLKTKSTALHSQINENQKETGKLRQTTDDLRNVLSSAQARGQWGERMVEDILAIMGLVENVNFVSHKKVESGEIPDYTFKLPKGKSINMDVKFPITHYENFVEAEDESEKEREKKQFLDDVKGHIKAVSDRGYIDPIQGTVDFVLLFIPNEGIYAFIHQSDASILDFALKNRVVLCSPITLYAVLSLIHQSVNNFAIEEKAGEIMSIMQEFEKQWTNYVESMEKIGRSLDAAKTEYDKLTTTRTRQLEKPLGKIQEIKLLQQDDSKS